MRLTYSTKLVLNQADKQKLMGMLEFSTFCWNECSKVKFGIKKNSIIDLHSAFYKDFLSKYDCPAQIVIANQRSVLSAYRSVKSNKHKLQTPAIKKKMSIQLDKRMYSYKNGIFSLISMGKRVKCQPYIYPKLVEFLGKYPFCDPLLFVRDGEIHISLTFKMGEKIHPQTLATGIDVGCRINAATSEGNLYVDKKFNKEKRELRYLKRSLQSKAKKGSRSAKKHLHRLRRKERNKNRNFTHNLTKKLIKESKGNVLVIENLKSIKVKKNRFQNKNRISQIPLYEFRRVLTYKAPIYGKTVIEVSPAYTSQIDHITGKKDGIRQGRRYYSKTGKVWDSDVNGAIVIARRSKLPISYSNVVDGQAKVNRLNV